MLKISGKPSGKIEECGEGITKKFTQRNQLNNENQSDFVPFRRHTNHLNCMDIHATGQSVTLSSKIHNTWTSDSCKS